MSRALELRPKGSGLKYQQCEPCGHAIARFVCSICFKPLCKRHTNVVNQQAYCREHIPGYQEQ
jgi:hypothetical protein